MSCTLVQLSGWCHRTGAKKSRLLSRQLLKGVLSIELPGPRQWRKVGEKTGRILKLLSKPSNSSVKWYMLPKTLSKDSIIEPPGKWIENEHVFFENMTARGFLGKLRKWEQSKHPSHPVCVKTKHPTASGGLLKAILQFMLESATCLYCYICSTVLYQIKCLFSDPFIVTAWHFLRNGKS